MGGRASGVALMVWIAACSRADPVGIDSSPAVCTPLPLEAQASLPERAALFTILPEPVLSAEQQRRLANIQDKPWTAELHVAQLSDAADSLLRSGNAIMLQVSPTRFVAAESEPVTQSSSEYLSWTGPVQGVYGWATLVLGDARLTGTLWVHPGPTYRFAPLGEGFLMVNCVDGSKFPPDDPPDD